jgi:hypothetical protein
MVNIVSGTNTAGEPAIALVLGAEDVWLKPDGDPTPGVALSAPQAREIAYWLLLLAQRLDNGKPSLFESAPASQAGEPKD